MQLFNEINIPTKEFFVFLKYNKVIEKLKDKLTQQDQLLYIEFFKKVKELNKVFEENKSASSEFGSLMSIFGFKRHYCGTCGIPIIGRFSKVGNIITCQPCYDSYKIIQAMENIEITSLT